MNKIKPLWRRRSQNSFRIYNFILVQWATMCLCTFLISGSTCASQILRPCALKLSPLRLSSSVVFSILCCVLCLDFGLSDQRPFAVYSPFCTHAPTFLSLHSELWSCTKKEAVCPFHGFYVLLLDSSQQGN